MNPSMRLLILWAVFHAILLLPAEARSSPVDWDVDETGSILPLSTDYLVGDHRARPLGPFDPFWWWDRSADQEKQRGKKYLEKWRPVRLVTSQGTAVHEGSYVAEPRSGAEPTSSGGGVGGSRTRHWSQLLSLLTPSTHQALSCDYPTGIPDSTSGLAAKTGVVATPLPSGVLLFGSCLAVLIALGRRHAFPRNA